MAIDPRISLGAQTVNAPAAMSQGFQLGKSIADTVEQRRKSGMQDKQSMTLDLFSAWGDQPVTAENYTQFLSTVGNMGYGSSLDDDDMVASDKNINDVNNVLMAGKNLFNKQMMSKQGSASSRGYAPQLVQKQTGVDDKGNPVMDYFYQGSSYDPKTDTYSMQEWKAGAQPTGAYGLTASGAVEQAGDIAGAKAEGEIEGKTRLERELQEIKNEAEINKQGALARAKEEAKQEVQELAAVNSYNDLLPTLQRFDEYGRQGIYGGNLMDKGARWASKLGVVLDAPKLERTARARMIATQLKFMAKPSNMGAMTEGEWKIIQEAIPDPDSATEGELIAGVDEFKRLLRDKAGSKREQVASEVVITSQEEFDNLEEGTVYISAKTGKRATK